MARDLKLDLQETVNYPLVAIPPSIALPDGTLRKTNKAKLIDSIKRHKFIDEMPSFSYSNSALVIDAMCLIHQLSPEINFFQFANKLLNIIIAKAKHYNVNRIDFVIDRYDTLSIKDIERRKRQQDDKANISIYNIKKVI